MHNHRRLLVWQRSRDLVFAVSVAVRSFPREDQGVLARQLRRAALSIPSNIAEGCGKESRRETIRFLQIAAASAREVDSHLEIAAGLGYLHERTYHDLAGRTTLVERMLAALMRNLPLDGAT